MVKKLKNKITDLEDFVEKDVWMPYLPIHPEFGSENNDIHDYRKIAKKMGSKLDETINHLDKYDDWASHIVDRISKVGYWFPDYIQHPIVDKLKKLIAETEKDS